MASLVLLSYRRLSYKKACIPQSLNLKFTIINKWEVLIRSWWNAQNIISGGGLGEGAITDFWNLWPKNGKISMEKKRACTLYHSFSSFRPNLSLIMLPNVKYKKKHVRKSNRCCKMRHQPEYPNTLFSKTTVTYWLLRYLRKGNVKS